MEFYYFNDKIDIHGKHEVHKESCVFIPAPLNRAYLGYFQNDSQAMQTARAKYPSKKFDGCAYCMPDYHTG